MKRLIVFVAALIVYTVYRFWNVFLPHYTMAGYADGIGTVANIYGALESLSQYGGYCRYFVKTDGIGGGLVDQFLPTSAVWKIFYWFASLFTDAFGIYDFAVVLGFFLNGICGYFLARQLGLSFGPASFCALLLVNLEHFERRAYEHLSLALYFATILAIAAAWNFARIPKARNAIALALVLWLNLSLSEYFAYFSLYVICAIVLVNGLAANRRGLQEIKKLAVMTLLSSGAFFALALLTYSDLFFSDHVKTTLSQVTSYLPDEYSLYSARKPEAILRPGIQWVGSLLPDIFMKAHINNEFTFRVGIVVHLVTAVCTFMLWRRRREDCAKILLPAMFTLAAVYCVALMLALRPNNILSLAPITQAIAPMFRVGMRALLFADIAIILAFCLSLQFLAQTGFPRWANIMLGLLALFDVSRPGMQPWQQFRVEPVTRPLAYERLAHAPAGMTVHIPFHSPQKHRLEDDYMYKLARVFHHKPIINGLSFYAQRDLGNKLGVYFEFIDTRRLAHLSQSGIKYIICHRQNTHLCDVFIAEGYYHILTDVEDTVIFQSARDIPYNPSGFLAGLDGSSIQGGD